MSFTAMELLAKRELENELKWRESMLLGSAMVALVRLRNKWKRRNKK